MSGKKVVDRGRATKIPGNGEKEEEGKETTVTETREQRVEERAKERD